MKFIALTLFAIHCVSTIVQAAEPAKEDDKAKMLPRFGFHLGTLLPDQIEGVTEIIPMAGVRYSIPRKNNLLEFGLMESQSLGINFYTLHADLRADIPMEGMFGLIYAGLDGHYYKAPIYTAYRMAAGAHIGGGVIAPLSEYLNFRGEMKFNLNPGVSLYLGFGFEMLFPGGDDKDDKK